MVERLKMHRDHLYKMPFANGDRLHCRCDVWCIPAAEPGGAQVGILETSQGKGNQFVPVRTL